MFFRDLVSIIVNRVPKISCIPRKIFAISMYGLTLSMSTQMLYSQLVLYLKYELKIGESKIALIDGFVEFLSYLTRIFSGILSDYMHNRKMLIVAGCAILCITKPIFAMAQSVGHVLFAEILERLGNGIQACPRDALISDLSEGKRLTTSFGFFKSFKTIGALLGAAVSLVIMYWGNYKILFWCAIIPSLASLFILLTVGDASSKKHRKAKIADNPFQKKYLKSLNKQFWTIILLAGICELSYFGESLLTIRMSAIISPKLAGITAIFIGIGQTLFAYPMGLIADSFGKILMLKICLLLSIFSHVLILSSSSAWLTLSGVLILCGQQASMQNLFLSLINEYASEELRATAIGILYCIIGTSYMIASQICGQLYEHQGYEYAFLYGIIACFVGLAATKFSQKLMMTIL